MVAVDCPEDCWEHTWVHHTSLVQGRVEVVVSEAVYCFHLAPVIHSVLLAAHPLCSSGVSPVDRLAPGTVVPMFSSIAPVFFPYPILSSLTGMPLYVVTHYNTESDLDSPANISEPPLRFPVTRSMTMWTLMLEIMASGGGGMHGSTNSCIAGQIALIVGLLQSRIRF